VNPIPIELPLRPSEAAQLAGLVLESVEGRKLTEDLRNRLAGRASALELTTVRPYFGSLEPDPVHASAYFLAVDGLSGAEAEPLLLHMAPASAPSSPLFANPMLIGRMRPGGGAEMVINAIPFGPSNQAEVEVYARRLGSVFLPRAHGLLPSVRVMTREPAVSAPAAFRAFRTILKTTGRNLAGFGLEPRANPFWALVWAAIRSGYRDGYTVGGAHCEETARLFSCFSVPPAEIGDVARQLRSIRPGEPLDMEADLSACGAGELQAALEGIRAAGVSIQSVRLPAELAELGPACAAVNAAGALPAVGSDAPSAEWLAQVREATSSRLVLILRLEGSDAGPLTEAVEALRR
jgi:hypothetical protein